MLRLPTPAVLGGVCDKSYGLILRFILRNCGYNIPDISNHKLYFRMSYFIGFRIVNIFIAGRNNFIGGSS